jgi:single-strand DNA-binding protein
MSINRVMISGNLTRDPEMRSTQSGMNILNFGMAVNDRRRNSQTGEWEDYANFVDCVLFGNRAEFLSHALHKGIKVVVEGKLRYSSWERDGQRRSKLEVVVDDLDFVSPRQQQGGYGQQNGYGGPSQGMGYNSAPQGGYGGQQSYGQQSSQDTGAFNASAPMSQPTPNYEQPVNQAPQMPAAQRPVVSAPPQADVYDEDIPF